jgi:hypothetical protein
MIFRLTIAALLILLPVDARAQAPGWTKSPAIIILGAADDPRVPLIRDAVAFWNGVMLEISSPFRLREATVAQNPIPEMELKKLSEITVGGLAGKFPMPDGVRSAPGDMVIALADIDFVSFAARWPDENKALVAIKSHKAWPLTLPNVMRNVIAHEIGHAIGLFHNADPAMLMCGRPAECRPELFRSDGARYFPLTEQDRNDLRRMYAGNGIRN